MKPNPFTAALCAVGAHRIVADHDEHAWRWRCGRPGCTFVESFVPIDPDLRAQYMGDPDVRPGKR